MKKTLADYVIEHTVRGECQCGLCLDKGNKPDPEGHTADMMFFKVAVKGKPDADTLRALVKAHKGDWGDCSPLDGAEHNYIEIGAWIGDQGLGMRFMALASLLKLCSLLTPRTMLKGIPDDLAMQMAQQGMVAIQAIS